MRKILAAVMVPITIAFIGLVFVASPAEADHRWRRPPPRWHEPPPRHYRSHGYWRRDRGYLIWIPLTVAGAVILSERRSAFEPPPPPSPPAPTCSLVWGWVWNVNQNAWEPGWVNHCGTPAFSQPPTSGCGPVPGQVWNMEKKSWEPGQVFSCQQAGR